MADHKHNLFNGIASLRIKQLNGMFRAQITNYINVNFLIKQDTHGQSTATINPKGNRTAASDGMWSVPT